MMGSRKRFPLPSPLPFCCNAHYLSLLLNNTVGLGTPASHRIPGGGGRPLLSPVAIANKPSDPPSPLMLLGSSSATSNSSLPAGGPIFVALRTRKSVTAPQLRKEGETRGEKQRVSSHGHGRLRKNGGRREVYDGAHPLSQPNQHHTLVHTRLPSLGKGGRRGGVGSRTVELLRAVVVRGRCVLRIGTYPI